MVQCADNSVGTELSHRGKCSIDHENQGWWRSLGSTGYACEVKQVMRSRGLVLLFVAAEVWPVLMAQVETRHVLTPLAKVKFVADDDVRCLSYAVESGDPDKGPSTMILKASPKCVVPWHYHSAQEELMVARGNVLTEMEGVPTTTLELGGFGTMRSEEKHQFTCTGKSECILFVTFDRVYDIHWVKQKK